MQGSAGYPFKELLLDLRQPERSPFARNLIRKEWLYLTSQPRVIIFLSSEPQTGLDWMAHTLSCQFSRVWDPLVVMEGITNIFASRTSPVIRWSRILLAIHSLSDVPLTGHGIIPCVNAGLNPIHSSPTSHRQFSVWG
jgi:hypothetical protein